MADLAERSIAEWQALMHKGEISAVQLSDAFISRMASHDVLVHAIAEVNPDALEIAAERDAERRSHGARSPLHGIPIVVKDNIDSADAMATTAGSLALEGHIAERDAYVIARLREAGAVLLAKTNLSEWANFRSTRSASGWSSRGGQVRNPYARDRSPCGSSSGSGVAVAANFTVAALGTETDGSVVCPASVNGIVGLKPTVGLVSRTGIVPISHSQDTAGTMTRCVADAALLLQAIAGSDPEDPATQAAQLQDYSALLHPDGLQGARIGVARDYFGKHEAADALIEDALQVLEALGATLVDPVTMPNLSLFGEAEFEVLLHEFKHDLNAYLASHRTPFADLEALIHYNRAQAAQVMPYFQQELFELAQAKGDLQSAVYQQARATALRLSRDEGIDQALRNHQLDALIAPTQTPAWMIDPICGDKVLGGCSSPAAMAGYPHITVPAGYVHGLPVGLSFFSSAWQEAKLLQYAYAFEQATQWRQPPTFAAHAAGLEPPQGLAVES